ncbi:MMPL family transporter [Tsukamurella soli]|uniref:MMPL family transporter n=1 Tax=Tsukamurella soli TaxID=644556 RepID=A0ABP8KH29_9ACTN
MPDRRVASRSSLPRRGPGARWAAILDRRSGLLLLFALVVLVAAGMFGSGAAAALSDGGTDDPASPSAQETVAEKAVFHGHSIDVLVAYSSPTMTATDPRFRAEVQKVVAGYTPGTVTSTSTWYQTHDPAMLSHDRHSVLVFVSVAGNGATEQSRVYRELEPSLRATPLGTRLAGPFPVGAEATAITMRDLTRAETISAPLVLVLAVLIFGSVVAAAMPLLVGVVAVTGAMSALRVIAGFTEVSSLSINVVTLLGLGLAVDYALFVVNRFREELDRYGGRYPRTAVLAVTLETAGRTVMFSALTVAAALSSLLVFPQVLLKSIAYGGIAAVLIAAIAALTVLPAALCLLGPRINAWSVPAFGHRRRGGHSGPSGWERVAGAVMRRPVAYVAVVGVVLVAMGLPLLGVRWAGSDYHTLPPWAVSYGDSQAIADDFGTGGATADVVLTAADGDLDVVDAARYAARLRAVDGVASVDTVDATDGAVMFQVGWPDGTQTEHSQALVRALRAVPPPEGDTELIGGPTAETVDMLDALGAGLPWMVTVVVLVMGVLLFLAFGSVVLPIKAVAMSAVSLFASFGVVTWVFCDGHLERLLGFSSTGALDPTVPILMLAVLFGLSMDYEVFLLSRVRDEWRATGDNTRAVSVGLAKTGRIITSAALLLAVVVGAFGLSGMVFVKMLGLGMLVALLVDATLVRALLVPATMKLLGDWNWWAPTLRWPVRTRVSAAGAAEPVTRPDAIVRPLRRATLHDVDRPGPQRIGPPPGPSDAPTVRLSAQRRPSNGAPPRRRSDRSRPRNR